jgi:hypothetical protein
MPAYSSTDSQRLPCPDYETGQCWGKKKLEKRLQSADWKLLEKMEYTAVNTPQQNALVEPKFTYQAAKARAAMHAAAVPRDRRLDFFLRWL